MNQFLLVAGVLVLTLALRSYKHPIFHRLGSIGILVTSFLIGYLPSKNIAAGIAFASIWFFLPWLELLTRVRALRMPRTKTIEHTPPPNSTQFPDLDSVTQEVENQGFEYVDDTGWKWEDHSQFFRLLYHPETKALASICLVEQSGIAFYYLSYSSRTEDGSLWTTWNYPFSYSLLLPPHLKVKRMKADTAPLELYSQHQKYLAEQSLSNDQVLVQSPQIISDSLQQDMQKQVTHNLDRGLLIDAGDGKIRYSWRGLVYLWLQFLRELAR